ncbi:MAG: VCBS repeat-containing protein [Candidatus Omnitrophica bacterium]|nr:VCBS repeat-containing protein [Candidatus Omnitrophota bacterium]
MFRKSFIIALICHLLIVHPFAFSGEASKADLNRLRLLGTAYMEEEDFENAVRVFKEAAAIAPQSASDVINLGIAHYHGDLNDDSIRILSSAREMAPDNPFANYSLGLAYKKIGDTTNALSYFERVAAVDQSDPATLYNLGLANFNLKNNDVAAQWFEKTIQLDPKHSASFYNLFLYYARVKKDMAYAKKLMTQFQELKKTEPDRPADAVDEGKFLGPIEFDIPVEERLNFTSDLPARFAISDVWTEAVRHAVGSTDGRFLAAIPDLPTRTTALVVSERNWKTLDNPQEGEKTHVLIVDAKGSVIQQSTIEGVWSNAAPADYDNDGDVDLILHDHSKTAMYRNEGDWNLMNVTGLLRLPSDGCSQALWTDFDAEGDLDLFLARPNQGDLILQNNGNGGFENITGSIEGLSLGRSQSLAASDLDNDNDLDIVRFDINGNLEIFENLREVRFQKFHSSSIQEEGVQNAFVQIECKDFDNDGTMEIGLTGWKSPNAPIFRLDAKKQLQPVELCIQLNGRASVSKTADVNNDGYEDFLLDLGLGSAAWGFSGAPYSPIVINQHPRTFSVPERNSDWRPEEILQGGFYFKNRPVITDLDFDGDLDLLAFDQNLHVFENQASRSNRSIALKIEGAKNSTEGYGAKILVKDDLFFVKKEVGSSVTHIGVGERDQVDVIRITWPNGIFQNLIHTPAGTIRSVTEKPGYAGSCLFVYTWNGREYEFIADSLCNAPLGLYVGGGYYPPNPDEYIRILGDQMQKKDGAYEILMREELREITYLDQMELLSATHPETVEIHSNECFTMPPFPEFQLIGMSKNARPPRRVVDNHGRDVTELIAQNDYRYPIPWKGESRMDGIVKEHYFEIDLGDIGDAQPIYLFMTGYLDWPNSSNARALEQNPEHDFVMPLLQVKNAEGEWQTVRNPMGFPAGKLKTVPVDLTDVFLTEDRTLRIASTVQVHWDRMLVDDSPILDGFTIEHYPLKDADLRYGGYARTYQLSDHGPQWYDYSARYTNSRWDYQIGDFTRFGDVTPLLTAFDDKYAIIQHGDEVCVHFDAGKAPRRESGSLTFFMKAIGWVKDLDSNTAFSQTVEPLPFKGMSGYPYGEDESYPWDEEHVAYWLQYNTRVFNRRNEPLRIPRTIAAPQAAHSSLRESE